MSSLIIYQGDNQVIVIQKIKELKKTFDEGAISTFSLKNLSFDQIIVDISTPNFFNDKRLAIIEDAEEKKIDLNKVPQDKDLTLVLTFKKEFTSASNFLKEATKLNAQIISLSQPQDKTIFTFLDLVAEKNNRSLEYFEPLMKNFGSQYLLTMILFLLRRLALPPQSGVPSFIAHKTEKQRKNFSADRIKQLYKTTLETDFLIKSGKADEKTALLILVNKFLN